MYLAIDGRRLIREPHSIEIAPYDQESSMAADGRPLVRPGSEFVQLNCTWGRDLSYQDVLAELDRLRANQGVHSITFEPRDSKKYLTFNAYMTKPRVLHVGYTDRGKVAVSSFSVGFVQVELPTYLFPLRWICKGILAVASPAASHVAPAAGRIVAVDGWIADSGAGAGQTRVQISHGATNYLATPGDFVVGGSKSMANAVLAANIDFAQGDQMDLDITTVPAGGMSSGLVVTAWCWVYRP